MNGRQVHRGGTVVFSVMMLAIGVALVVQSIATGASPLSGRLLLGVLFAAAGAGRLYLELIRSRRA